MGFKYNNLNHPKSTTIWIFFVCYFFKQLFNIHYFFSQVNKSYQNILTFYLFDTNCMTEKQSSDEFFKKNYRNTSERESAYSWSANLQRIPIAHLYHIHIIRRNGKCIGKIINKCRIVSAWLSESAVMRPDEIKCTPFPILPTQYNICNVWCSIKICDTSIMMR